MGSRLRKIEHAQCALTETPDVLRDEAMPDADLENLTRDLMRDLSDAFGDWRACPAPRCRRARCCQGPDMICQLGGGPCLNASREDLATANRRARAIVEGWLDRFGVARA